MRELKCLRCGEAMEYLETESLTYGMEGMWGKLSQPLNTGLLEVSVYACPKCGKYEFFKPDPSEINEDDLPLWERLERQSQREREAQADSGDEAEKEPESAPQDEPKREKRKKKKDPWDW